MTSIPTPTRSRTTLGTFLLVSLLTLNVLAGVHAQSSGSAAGGTLKVIENDPPLARWLPDGPPYGGLASPCTTAGRAQVATTRTLQVYDRGFSADENQPITKLVLSTPRLSASKFIQYLPSPASSSYHLDPAHPDAAFPNVTYIPGEFASTTRPGRPDQLVFEGGSMDHGGLFRIAFSVIGASPGTIFDVRVTAFFANGRDGLSTGGVALGSLEDAAGNQAGDEGGPDALCAQTTTPTETVDADENGNCPSGYSKVSSGGSTRCTGTPPDINGAPMKPAKRDLEIRIDSEKPTILDAEVFDQDGNGHLDHARIYFSERLDLVPFRAASLHFESRIGNKAYPYTVIDPTVWDADHKTVMLTLKEIPLYDTGAIPAITYPAAGTGLSIMDVAGNAPTNLRFTAAIDRAAPVLVSAYAYKGSRELVVTFSEGVVSNGRGALCPAFDPAKSIAGAEGDRLGTCNFEYYDGRPSSTSTQSSSPENCIRNINQMSSDFEEPSEDDSPLGGRTYIFRVRQTDPTTGAPRLATSFCDADVNYTAGYNDHILARPGDYNSATNYYEGAVVDLAGNRVEHLADCNTLTGLEVDGSPIHDGATVRGRSTTVPGPCRDDGEVGSAVPVTGPRVTWVEVDNDHNYAVVHFSGPVNNVSKPGSGLAVSMFDLVPSTGGGAGGITDIQHESGTDSALLKLDFPINPVDVSANPSKLRIRCDGAFGAPWSFVLGNGLPGKGISVHGTGSNRLPDGTTVPASVTVPCGDYEMQDLTPPRIVDAWTADTNHDGFVDGYNLEFSEPVDDASFCGGLNPSAGTCPAPAYNGILSFAGPPTTLGGYRAEIYPERGIDRYANFTYETGVKDNDRFGLIRYPQAFPPSRTNLLYTDAVPDLVTSAQGRLFMDLKDPLNGGNRMLPIGSADIRERDGAGPHPMRAASIDSLRSVAPYNPRVEGDGYIDAYRVTFSEAVDDSSFTACEWQVATHNVTSYQSFAVGDAGVTRPAYILSDDNQLLVSFVSHNRTDPDGDTDAKPQMTYVLGGSGCANNLHPSGLKDVFGNPMADVGVGDVEEADTAGPVMVKVLAYTGDRNITAVFSEPVDNGNGKPLVWRDFLYGNKNPRLPTDQVAGQSTLGDAIQMSFADYTRTLSTHQAPASAGDNQYVLMPVDDALSGPVAGGKCATCDIGSDILSVVSARVRETSPSVPASQRQYVQAVPHVLGAAPDVVPPGTITDLAVNTGRTNGNTIVVQWHAPADDGLDMESGSVANYTIKVSRAQIDATNFDAVANDPKVSASVEGVNVAIVGPNQLQSAIVTGLDPVTTYYVAVRAVDEAGNIGPVSNTVSALTKQDLTPPVGDLKVYVASSNLAAVTAGKATFCWNSLTDPEGTVVYRFALNQDPNYQVLSTDTQTSDQNDNGQNSCTDSLHKATRYGIARFPADPSGTIPDGQWTFHVAAFSGGGQTKTSHFTITVGAGAIDAKKLAAADQKVQTTSVRVNGLNTVSWVLPEQKTLPAKVEGIEIWRLDNGIPLRLANLCGVSQGVADIDAACPGSYDNLRRGNFTDYSSTATKDSQYRVDMVFQGGQTQPDTLQGFQATRTDTTGQVPWWVYVVIGVALALLVAGAILFVVLRKRNRQAQRDQAVPYQWAATGDVATDPVSGLPVHDVKCPNCATDFQAQGELPLQISCPSCGVTGVLN